MKHAVITGAANGIGEALARRLVRAGYSVTGVDVDANRAADLEPELGARFVIADLSTDSGVVRVNDRLASMDTIDVLIHNAGINAVRRFPHVGMTDQEKVVAINFQAPMVLTAGLLEADRIAPGGSLVFVSSLSHYVSYPGAAAYAATKSGLASYARSLSVALAPREIHVMTVFPGPTRTAHARRYSPDNSREEKRMPPEDLAEAILRGIEKRRRLLVPGFGNRTAAFLGAWCPRVVERVMRRAMLEKN
ncbi:MAG: SDR family NAD(P)-dependent oxidoreductase [Gemmatimonadota bacterium]|nr:SDR family NAD(P)-dependent oxidoreductase [Gemmatimonadota bacterium]